MVCGCGQAAKRVEKAEKRGKRPEPGAQLPPLRQRDAMLSHVRAFQRLRPEDRNALLTEKVPICRFDTSPSHAYQEFTAATAIDALRGVLSMFQIRFQVTIAKLHCCMAWVDLAGRKGAHPEAGSAAALQRSLPTRRACGRGLRHAGHAARRPPC